MESRHGILPHRMTTDLHHTPLAIVTILPAVVSINCILSEVCTEAKEIVEHSAYNKTDTVFSVMYNLRLTMCTCYLFICICG